METDQHTRQRLDDSNLARRHTSHTSPALCRFGRCVVTNTRLVRQTRGPQRSSTVPSGSQSKGSGADKTRSNWAFKASLRVPLRRLVEAELVCLPSSNHACVHRRILVSFSSARRHAGPLKPLATTPVCTPLIASRHTRALKGQTSG